MRIALFVPCYVDQLYPDVGLATLEILENLGLEVDVPEDQTCCGQPMANMGISEDAAPLARRFVRVFRGYDYVVAPSGSCVAMVRHHYESYLGHDPDYEELAPRVFELAEFLVDVMGAPKFELRFPFRVGLHQSCHGLRELRLASGSERVVAKHNKVRQLLSGIEGLELCDLARPDECCGFGGTFAVAEEAVACRMGMDRIGDHEKHGAQVLTAGDMSCLMHLEGLVRRQRRPLAILHLAQILAGRQPDFGHLPVEDPREVSA